MQAVETWRFSLIRTLVVLVVLLGLPTSCGENAPAASVQRDANLYEAAVLHLIDASGVDLAAGWDDPVVFVEVLEPESVDLETQVAVVDDLEETYRIRFVDELAEAVEMEIAELPVREGTLLVAFGPLVVDDTELVLHGEYYLDADTTAAFEYRFLAEMSSSADDTPMTMIGPPADVPTELVVVAP